MINSNFGGYALTTVDGQIAYYKESEGADSAVPFISEITSFDLLTNMNSNGSNSPLYGTYVNHIYKLTEEQKAKNYKYFVMIFASSSITNVRYALTINDILPQAIISEQVTKNFTDSGVKYTAHAAIVFGVLSTDSIFWSNRGLANVSIFGVK